MATMFHLNPPSLSLLCILALFTESIAQNRTSLASLSVANKEKVITIEADVKDKSISTICSNQFKIKQEHVDDKIKEVIINFIIKSRGLSKDEDPGAVKRKRSIPHYRQSRKHSKRESRELKIEDVFIVDVAKKRKGNIEFVVFYIENDDYLANDTVRTLSCSDFFKEFQKEIGPSVVKVYGGLPILQDSQFKNILIGVFVVIFILIFIAILICVLKRKERIFYLKASKNYKVNRKIPLNQSAQVHDGDIIPIDNARTMMK